MNFITAGGVFLQSLVFGYGGVRFHDQGMRLDPLLPPGAENAPFRSHFIQKDQFTKTCSGQSIGAVEGKRRFVFCRSDCDEAAGLELR